MFDNDVNPLGGLHIHQISAQLNTSSDERIYFERMVFSPRLELQRLVESVQKSIGGVLKACGGPTPY